MAKCEYLEMKILGRTCYMTQDTIRIFQGLLSHTKGVRKFYHEIPSDAFIVRVDWSRKGTSELARERIISNLEKRKNANSIS